MAFDGAFFPGPRVRPWTTKTLSQMRCSALGTHVVPRLLMVGVVTTSSDWAPKIRSLHVSNGCRLESSSPQSLYLKIFVGYSRPLGKL